MSVRSALRALIFQSAGLMDEIPQDRWVSRGSVETDVYARPFAVITSVGDNRFIPGATRKNVPDDFEIWIHDDPGSYVNIDRIIEALEDYLNEATNFQFGGRLISQVDVQSASPDLNDDVLHTVTRSLRVRVLGTAL